jgi:cytochrome c oxidase subunit 3
VSVHSTALPATGAAHGETHNGLSRRSNEWLGMILFLASEAVIFGSLFAQYFYVRMVSSSWPPAVGLPPDFQRVPAGPLALILTVVLAASGFTAHWAQSAIRKDDRESAMGWLGLSAALGLLFLGGQAYEYNELVQHGFGINSGIYGTVFYMLTGLHGLHVTVGVVLLVAILLRTWWGHFTARSHFGFEGTILYWHFVDIVWFFLYFVLYLL